MNSRGANILLLGLNLGLVGIIAYLVHLLRSAPPVALAPVPPRAVTNTVTQIAVRKVNATNLLALLANRVSNWGMLESSNYYAFMANLRAFGCPEETIRDIVLTDLARAYAKRRAALRGKSRASQTNEAAMAEVTAEVQAEMQSLDREQRMFVKALLGVDFQTEMAKYWDAAEYAERVYGFLPAGKREALLAFLERFDESERAIYARSRGVFTAEQLAQLDELEKSKRQQLAGLLTPEELAQFDMRFSTTAQNLRAQLGGFETTEEEFRRMFEAQQALETQPTEEPAEDRPAEVQAAAQQQAQQLYEEELKRIFGELRYGEWLRWQDQDYQALVQMADGGQFPRDVANRVYEMRQEAERQRQSVASDSDLNESQRQRALEAIARETEKSVASVMGQRNYQRYRKSAGEWLQNLNRPPAGAEPQP